MGRLFRIFSDRAKGFALWLLAALQWLLDKAVGDTVFGWITSMIPITLVPNPVNFLWTWGVPISLFVAGIFFFYRADRSKTSTATVGQADTPAEVNSENPLTLERLETGEARAPAAVDSRKISNIENFRIDINDKNIEILFFADGHDVYVLDAVNLKVFVTRSFHTVYALPYRILIIHNFESPVRYTCSLAKSLFYKDFASGSHFLIKNTKYSLIIDVNITMRGSFNVVISAPS